MERKFCQASWINGRGISFRFPRLCFRDTPTVVNNIGLKKKNVKRRGVKMGEKEWKWKGVGEAKGREENVTEL